MPIITHRKCKGRNLGCQMFPRQTLAMEAHSYIFCPSFVWLIPHFQTDYISPTVRLALAAAVAAVGGGVGRGREGGGTAQAVLNQFVTWRGVSLSCLICGKTGRKCGGRSDTRPDLQVKYSLSPARRQVKPDLTHGCLGSDFGTVVGHHMGFTYHSTRFRYHVHTTQSMYTHYVRRDYTM